MNKAILLLIVCLFLSVIGGGIWKRTEITVAPPIYDPIGYYCRAQLVWSALAKGDFHGVLNGPMSIRPPGTVFALYPFGFRSSVRSFIFRSVFVSILIWAIALSVSIIVLLKSRFEALLGSALVIGLSSMPLFYQFEFNEEFTKLYQVVNQWGLVDSLEAATAGLATSVLCLGIAKRRLIWCISGWLIGAFAFFIKPSGVLVMVTLAGIATVEFLIRYFDSHSDRRTVFKFAIPVYITGFLVYGVALWLALGSDYMSREVIAQAVRASQLLISIQQQGPSIFETLVLFVTPVFGWWWFSPGVLFIGLLGVEAVQSMVRRQWTSISVKLGAAAIILTCSLCWWIFLAGQAHRYLFPFLLMVIVWFIPELFQRLVRWKASAKWSVIGYCLAPVLLLSGMLWSKNPPVILQHFIGVNLSAGGRAAEVSQGKWLLAESERRGRPLNLYSIGNFDVGAVEMVDWVNSVQKRNVSHRFIVSRPLNWIDNPGLRMEELTRSDFLLLEDVSPAAANEASTISSWTEEVNRFKQFAYLERGPERNGLELVSDGSVKLLRVADLHKFKEALNQWANSIHWADDFRERNKAFLENPTK